MDTSSELLLKRIFRDTITGSLGTLRDGSPYVSMTPFVVSPHTGSFYIHVSRLAHHTQDFLQDARVSMLVVERDELDRDPQTIGRVTIVGEAVPLSTTSAEYPAVKSLYQQRFPDSERTFSLGDFLLVGIRPRAIRFVAGLGKAYTLTIEDIKRAAG